MGRKSQQGAALVIVMMLLAGAMMLGVSAMQSALIDERLAGNFRASALAQMSAESEAANLINRTAPTKPNLPDCSNAPTESLKDREKWTTTNEPVSDLASARYKSCVSKTGNTIFAIEGYVGQGSQPDASHFMAAGQIPSPPPNPNSTETIEDFIDFIAGSGSVVKSCDSTEIAASTADYAYCDGNYTDDITPDIDGKTIVATGNVDSNLKTRGRNKTVVTSVIALGNIIFRGSGPDYLEGVMWSGDNITFNGNANVRGEVLSIADNITINGQNNISSGKLISELLDDTNSPGGNYEWDPL